MGFFLFIFLSILSLAVLYLYAMVFASFFARGKPREENIHNHGFAVIVPAHNEEKLISKTLASLKAISYPPELFQIIVIADNCSDNTAKIVRSCGVRCLERFDPSQRGKGHALRYAFDVLLPEGFQAMAVVDADTLVKSNFLEVMNYRLSSAEKVLQARNGVLNPDDSSLTYMLAVGNGIENDLFLRGRENWGLPSLLRGTGMCFNSAVLRSHPWHASSVAEDTEYSLVLLRQGVKIHFVPETEVLSSLPATVEQASEQRIRWASGNSRLARLEGFSLIAEGLKQKRLDLTEMGMCLFIRSKPLLLLFAVILIAFGIFSGMFVTWALFLCALLAFYILLGMVVMGPSFFRLKLALIAPFSLFWLIMISLLGIIGFRSNVWTRTRRS